MYQYELVRAAKKLVEDMFELKKDEVFIITADTESDMDVVNAVASCAHAIGAKPMIITFPSPLGVGKVADEKLPIAALEGALCAADAWVEFNNKWLLYSTPFIKATEKNKNLRYLCLVGMNASMMVRNIGRVNQSVLSKFLKKVAAMNKNAKMVRLVTEGGCDISFEIDSNYKIFCDDGKCCEPGVFMLGGQITLFPKLGTINGKLVFDGSLTPPCGLLSDFVTLEIKDSRVINISGTRQARQFDKWIKGFNDEKMFNVAHMSYGFNPGAMLTGDILEDERVWGCVEWGIGFVNSTSAPPGNNAKSHADGICLNATVFLDGNMIVDNGIIVDEGLKALESKLND